MNTAGFTDLPSCNKTPLKLKKLFSKAQGTLRKVNAIRVEDLIPRKKLLYHFTRRYKRKHFVLQQWYSTAKKRIIKDERDTYK